jgi:protein SCO1/2
MPNSEHLRHRGAALLTAAVAAAVLTGCGPSPAAPPPPGASVGQQLDTPAPPALQSAVFVTSGGQRVTLDSFKGKVVVISDVMTLCQETCPLDTANVVAAARAVDAAGLSRRVEFLSITIDPARDAPTRLAAYRKLYRPAPANWLVLTAAPATLTAVWKSLGVYIHKVPDTPPAPKDWLTGKPLTYDLTHSDELFFLATNHHERFLLEGAPHVAAGAPIPATLRTFMDAQGRNNINHPDPLAWTLPQELGVISWLSGHRIPEANQ